MVGDALKAVSSWRLENGERLGLLDQMLGSTTLIGTLKTQKKLSAHGPLAGFLIILWALSPFGSQACTRVLGFSYQNTTSVVQPTYQDFSNMTSYEQFAVADSISTVLAPVNALFVSGLLTPLSTRTSSMDAWGNVKIPMIESLENFTQQDSDGWYPVNQSTAEYSSLLGIPVTSLSTTSNSTFHLETSYTVLDCFELFDQQIQVNNTAFAETWVTSLNWSSLLGPYTASMWIGADRNPRTNTTLLSDPNMPPTVLGYKGESTGDADYTFAKLYMRTTFVESEVHCKGTQCAVTRIRNSLLPHYPTGWTVMDTPVRNVINIWLYFTEEFPAVIPINRNGVSPIEQYIATPQTPFLSILGATNASQLDPGTFGLRFGQLFNTYIMSLLGYQNIPNGFNQDFVTDPNGYEFPIGVLNASNASFWYETEVLVCHTGWLVVLIISTSAIIIAVVIGALIPLFCKSPPSLLNATALVKDNPYADIPHTGSTLGGYERSKLLKNVRVKIGDVAAESEVGHISIGTLAGNDGVQKLSRRRLYD